MQASLRTAARLTRLCLAASLLAACASLPPEGEEQAQREPLYLQRAALLQQVEAWALEGRLAVSDDRDGGSGSFQWQNGAGDSRMAFHGALGRGAWRLEADERGAELVFADGTTHRAATVDALVREQLGWRVPIEALDWWVRGLAAPGAVQQRSLDPQGRLSDLQQDGWLIEYGRYGSVGDVTMPFRMTARQEGRTVKIAVKKWRLSSQNDPQD
jgi:outer membrane lipoprotein LolB